MKTAVCLVAALLALELQAPAFQETAALFVLGVLRRDGIVMPFALFDDGRWRSRWPADVRNRDLPISLDDIPGSWWGVEPAPRTMTIWRNGVRAGSIGLTGVKLTDPMCQPRITLTSDFKAADAVPPPFERPYPKEGLVAVGDAPLERIESVEKGAAEWNQALILITDQFNRQETSATREFTAWRHPVDEARRKLVPITIEAVYKAPMGEPAWTAYFVEAVRQYPPGRQDRDGCGLATFASGWVLVGPKAEAQIRISAKVTYCDRKGVSYMLPFGLIRWNRKVFWIYQFSGFEEEWYEVTEPTRRGVESHVAFPVGGC